MSHRGALDGVRAGLLRIRVDARDVLRTLVRDNITMAIKRYEPDAALQSIPQTRPVVHRTMRFAAIAVFALAGCSSGTSHIGPSAPTSPQSWNVQTGVSSQNEALQGLAYYPSAPLTIDVGDTMTWSFPANEPHTVALLGAGQTNPPAPTDPSAAKPAGGSTYDGSTFTNSGFLAGGKSYSLTFTKAGTYKVYCLIHQPQMEATIVVNAAGTPYPQTQGDLTRAGASASTADVAAAAAAVSNDPFVGNALHLAAGIAPTTPSGKPSSSTALRFLSTNDIAQTTATVPVGSSVTWTNLSNNELHSVTFGPVGQPFPTLNPFSPPSGGTTYDGSTLMNSGLLAPGQSFTATFPKAGTYTYQCLLHDDTEHMVATLIVN